MADQYIFKGVSQQRLAQMLNPGTSQNPYINSLQFNPVTPTPAPPPTSTSPCYLILAMLLIGFLVGFIIACFL